MESFNSTQFYRQLFRIPVKQKISVILDPEAFSWSPEELLENVLKEFHIKLSFYRDSAKKAVEEMEHGKMCEFGPFRFSKVEDGYLVEAICDSKGDACLMVMYLLDLQPKYNYSTLIKKLTDEGKYVGPWGTEF